MAPNPRRAIDHAIALANAAEFSVTELDLTPIDGTVGLLVVGHGRVLDVYYAPHPKSGYLRFRRADRRGLFGTVPIPLAGWSSVARIIRRHAPKRSGKDR